MYIENDLSLLVWLEYGRRVADRIEKEKRRGKDRLRRHDADRQARRYLDGEDVFNFPA